MFSFLKSSKKDPCVNDNASKYISDARNVLDKLNLDLLHLHCQHNDMKDVDYVIIDGFKVEFKFTNKCFVIGSIEKLN